MYGASSWRTKMAETGGMYQKISTIPWKSEIKLIEEKTGLPSIAPLLQVFIQRLLDCPLTATIFLLHELFQALDDRWRQCDVVLGIAGFFNPFEGTASINAHCYHLRDNDTHLKWYLSMELENP
jgi:hypothetical protein